jgi:hypothetical protein
VPRDTWYIDKITIPECRIGENDPGEYSVPRVTWYIDKITIPPSIMDASSVNTVSVSHMYNHIGHASCINAFCKRDLASQLFFTDPYIQFERKWASNVG